MPLTLGQARGRKSVRLTDEERSRHIHVLGASGTGKSKLLESMMRQDITNRRGFCLIDPHGTLADDVIQWCAATGMDKVRRIHVIEPSNEAWSVGFNPLRLDGGAQVSVRVDAMVSACAQVWGGEDANSTPLLKKCLRTIFYTLAIRELTLAEAPMLSTNSEVALRRSLTEGLPDEVFASVWGDFAHLSRREFFEQFSSTNNRMLEFLSSPVVRRIVGQRERALDLRSIMDGSEVLIVNLRRAGVLSPDNARLLGTLLTSEFFLTALSRDKLTANRRPFTLYIDECYDFLTSDIEGMLDQTRKFGLHVVLAHHRLSQLRARSESIYSGVMAGGQNKIVFGGLMDDDAETMAREIMRGGIDLERPKHILDKPVVVDEVPFWLESESWSESTSQSGSSSENFGSSSSLGTSSGLSESALTDGTITGSVTSFSNVAARGESSGVSHSQSWSRSTTRGGGRSQTLKPVRVMMPTSVHSLDEEMHLAIVKLRELPNQTAVIKRRGRLPIQVRTPHVSPGFASSARVEAFVETTRAQSPYLIPLAEAEAAVAARQLLMRAAAVSSRDAPEGADEFWT